MTYGRGVGVWCHCQMVGLTTSPFTPLQQDIMFVGAWPFAPEPFLCGYSLFGACMLVHLSRAVHHRGTCRDSALCRTATTVLMCERELGSCWWMNLHFSSSESLISLLALNLSLPHPFPFPLYKAGSPSSWRWELFSCFKSQFENVRVQILERKVWVLKARMFFLIRVMPSSREKPLCFYSSSVLVPKPFIWSD